MKVHQSLLINSILHATDVIRGSVHDLLLAHPHPYDMEGVMRMTESLQM